MASKKSPSVTPATKDDIQAMMAQIAKLYDANRRWTDDLKSHFDVAVENIRHDLLGVNREEIESLKDRSGQQERRIERLEMQAGLNVA
jgi:hypothetical protein